MSLATEQQSARRSRQSARRECTQRQCYVHGTPASQDAHSPPTLSLLPAAAALHTQTQINTIQTLNNNCTKTAIQYVVYCTKSKNKLFNHTSDTIINQTQLSFNEIERHYNFHYSQQSIIIWHMKIFMKTLAECNHFQFKQWCTLPLQAHQDCLHGWSGGSTYYTHLGLLRTLWFYGQFIAFMTMFGTVCIVRSRVHKTLHLSHRSTAAVACGGFVPTGAPQAAIHRQWQFRIVFIITFISVILVLILSF